MKIFLFLIIFFCFTHVQAEYLRFEENGKIGIKDESGNIVLSPEFEELGWSDGSFSVVNGLTGYRLGQQWGLINLKKEFVTGADFISLLKTDSDLFIALKIINAAQSLWGCLDSKGRVTIPFNYDGVNVHSLKVVVKKKEGLQLKYGLVDSENKILIPVQYSRIYPLGTLRFAVENSDRKISLFSESGKQITPFHFDSISTFKADKAILYKDLHQGILHRDGRILKEPVYREIKLGEKVLARTYDQWIILDSTNHIIREIEADQIKETKHGYRIEAGGKIGLMNQQFNLNVPIAYDELGFPQNNLLVARKNIKAGVIRSNNTEVIPFEFESLLLDGSFLLAQQNINGKIGWSLYDTLGIRKTQNYYDAVAPFNGRFFVVHQKQYAGAVDRYGKEIVKCVFDSLLDYNYDQLIVKYKGQYGIIDFYEKWLLPPQPYPIRLIEDSVYIAVDSTMKLLKNLRGDIIYFTDNKLEITKTHLVETLPDGSKKNISFDGLMVERSTLPTDQVLLQRIYDEKEGMRAMRKDGKFGFIDYEAKLRVPNRYDSVRSYSEGLAPIRIIGRWGFIDKEDNMLINPNYDWAEDFNNGFSIVRKNGKFGLINRDGEQVLKPEFDLIKRVNHSKFLLMISGKYGFADERGHVLVDPRFDELQYLNNGNLIVVQHNQYGLITEEGLSIIPIIYNAMYYLKNSNRYLVVKKSAWSEIDL